MGFTSLFALDLTIYRFYVRRLNKKLAGTPEQVRQAMKSGVTEEQVNMGWRYECY